MASPKTKASATATPAALVARGLTHAVSKAPSQAFAHATILEEARAAGLLQGDRSEHVSFRAPPALIEAAKREAGVTSTTELGLLALALLAQPDPVVSAMRRTRGRLGSDHQLEY
jgi:hypothetical protein